MDLSSYETRLENVETAVVEVKDVLDDKTDSDTGETTPGLKTRVKDIEDVLNDKTDSGTEETTPGLKTRVSNIEKNLSASETVPGLKLQINEIKTTLNEEEIPGLKSRVTDIESTIEGQIGLKFQLTQIRDLLVYHPNNPRTNGPDFVRIDDIEEDMRHIKDILDYKIDSSGNPTSGLKSQVENNTTQINDFSSIVSNISAGITGLQADISWMARDVDTLKKDIYDRTDSEGETIPGLKSLVETNISLIKSLQDSVESMSLGISGLTTAITGLPEIIKDINEKIDNGWDKFLEEKFQECMDIKKQVHDIITNCKVNEQDTPAYIMETSEQLQAMDLEMRRKVLSEILTKLKVFESLLDGQHNPLLDNDKMQSLQTYLDNTNVPKPEIKEIQSTLNYIIEGEYIKVTGATRAFTRSVGFKTGLPKESWMDQSYDYFAYGFLPVLEGVMSSENAKRADSNEAIRDENAKAQAKYDAGISTAERVTFPADNLTTLINDYNRILLRHEI